MPDMRGGLLFLSSHSTCIHLHKWTYEKLMVFRCYVLGFGLVIQQGACDRLPLCNSSNTSVYVSKIGNISCCFQLHNIWICTKFLVSLRVKKHKYHFPQYPAIEHRYPSMIHIKKSYLKIEAALFIHNSIYTYLCKSTLHLKVNKFCINL